MRATEVGGLATELVPHFFRSLADSLGAAMHITVTGENTHHMIEACFKGVGRALRQAMRREGSELPSHQGSAVAVADVAIIDSGGANLASLRYALERLGARSAVSTDPARISRRLACCCRGWARRPTRWQRLQAAGLTEVIPQLTQPLLGICLGMQLLFESSAEAAVARHRRLAWVSLRASVQRLAAAPDRPVPHMGWNQLTALRDDPLLAGIAPAEYVYFVHSYAAPVTNATVAVTGYGGQFAAVVRHDNFRGVQFHPERSATVGARMLANFLAIRE